MTPEEHYAEAERLLEGAEESIQLLNDQIMPRTMLADMALSVQTIQMMVATAQVHATLALAPRSDVALCPHGTTGLCMYCVRDMDLLRARSEGR